jgi:RNA polymerase sigma-70 factor (ECF subfamily)
MTARGDEMPDAGAFDEFYRGTGQRVVAYLYAAGGDLAEAQDAAQEAYMRAWQRWDSLAENDPEQWVRTVGWRILANRWRKLRGRLVAYRRHGLPAPSPALNEDAVALVTALRQLPPNVRVAVVLFHILELPVAAIAEQTQTPVGTVKARLVRGRQQLATLLKTTEPENHRV